MTDPDEDDERVGYAAPPRRHRFPPGESGNPSGRRPGSHSIETLRERVLNETIVIAENGRRKEVTRAEAFLLMLVKGGLQPRSRSREVALRAAEVAEAKRLLDAEVSEGIVITRCIVVPGSVTSALEDLRLARKRAAYRSTVKLVLEPWIVERQLTAMGKQQLSIPEQRLVENATRLPWRVRWPSWWHRPPFRRER